MSRFIEPPTIKSPDEQLRTLLGMLMAGWNFRQDPTNTSDMAAAVDFDMNQADYMGLLGLCMGLLLNTLTSLGYDPQEYIAMVSRQMMQDGV